MTASNGEKWMVAIVDKLLFAKNNNSSHSSSPSSHLISLPDPSTEDDRQYVLANSNAIVEIQSLAEDFSSFFVGRHVVKDGNLYVLNRVDPLLFVLAAQVADETKKYSWQPLDQTIGSLPTHVQSVLEEAQMGHLFQTMCNEQTDDMTYFKFSVSKALSWLQKKQERVYQVLLKQDQARQKAKKESFASMAKTKGGSVSSTFNMPEDPMATKPSENNLVVSNTKQLKLESVQIVCNYLSPAWSNKFIDSLPEITESQIFETAAPTKAKPYTTTAPSQNDVQKEAPAKPVKKEIMQPKTMGNKRLAKVSTKGMKSLGSFFTAPAKKKTKTQ